MRRDPSCRYLIKNVAVLVALSACASLVRADFGGDCHTSYNIVATTCNEVAQTCTSSKCYTSSNGDINYACYSPYSCAGWYSVPIATTSASTSTSTSTSSSGEMDACNSMHLSSCDDAESKFNSVGCSCFTCVETNGVVEASCTAPFSCTPSSNPEDGEELSAPPEMDNNEYGIVCAVYIATAFVLAGSAYAIAFFCFPKAKEEPSIKAIIAKRMPILPWLIYSGSLASFVQDDGSPVEFVDFICDKNDLVGLIDWRKTTASVRPRWMRGCAIVTTLMVTISLAFLLGTVVYNNENCVTTTTVNYCCTCHTWCRGEDLGCDGCDCKLQSQCSSTSYSCATSKTSNNDATVVTTFKCDSASIETSQKANWVTMALTMVVAKAGSLAVGTAEEGSPRQKLLHVATATASIALIIFGILYSNYLTKADIVGDIDGYARRLESIGATLFTGWWYDQVVGLGSMFTQFVVYYVGYCYLYQPNLEEITSAGAAVHPQGDNGLDKSIMKTEGIHGGVSEAVSVEAVTLQPPAQQ